MSLSPDELDAIADAATPGQWRVGHEFRRCFRHDGKHPGPPECVYERAGWREDDFHSITADHGDSAVTVAGSYEYDSGGIVHETDARLIALAPSLARDLAALQRWAEKTVNTLATEAHTGDPFVWGESCDDHRECPACALIAEYAEMKEKT